MNYIKHRELINDLIKVTEKHGLSLIIAQSDNLKKFQDTMDGITIFFTDGQPKNIKPLTSQIN